MIEHHSVKNLIVGAILTGGLRWGVPHQKVEVFNPFNQMACEMPDLSGDEQIFGFHLLTLKAAPAYSGATLCGDLLCSVLYGSSQKKCARRVGGSFVIATGSLWQGRRGHLCWARPNGVHLLGRHHPKPGVRLLGGRWSDKGRL